MKNIENGSHSKLTSGVNIVSVSLSSSISNQNKSSPFKDSISSKTSLQYGKPFLSSLTLNFKSEIWTGVHWYYPNGFFSDAKLIGSESSINYYDNLFSTNFCLNGERFRIISPYGMWSYFDKFKAGLKGFAFFYSSKILSFYCVVQWKIWSGSSLLFATSPSSNTKHSFVFKNSIISVFVGSIFCINSMSSSRYLLLLIKRPIRDWYYEITFYHSQKAIL